MSEECQSLIKFLKVGIAYSSRETKLVACSHGYRFRNCLEENPYTDLCKNRCLWEKVTSKLTVVEFHVGLIYGSPSPRKYKLTKKKRT